MKPRTPILLYFFLLAAECLATAFGSPVLHFVSKPLLMPVLAFYFYTGVTRWGWGSKLLIAALLFSWLGDVVLMFDRLYRSLFIYGLIAFLLAHVSYILYFSRIKSLNAPERTPKPVISVLVVVYMATFYLFLYPHVGGFKIPVLIYATCISLMLLSSLRAFDLRSQRFGRLCVAGAFAFALSDSILAFNRFVSPSDYAPVVIMLTYGIAQYLIVEGAARNAWIDSEQTI